MLEADREGRAGDRLRLVRDRALILIGFWRGFRSDELCRLQIEHIEVVAGEGMVIYLPRSKTDRAARGRVYTGTRLPGRNASSPTLPHRSMRANTGPSFNCARFTQSRYAFTGHNRDNAGAL